MDKVLNYIRQKRQFLAFARQHKKENSDYQDILKWADDILNELHHLVEQTEMERVYIPEEGLSGTNSQRPASDHSSSGV